MPLTTQHVTVDPHLHRTLLDTHTHLAQSLVGSLLLSPGPWYIHVFFFFDAKSLFPQSCGSSVIKSHWPSTSNSLGLSVCFLDPQVGKAVVGPWTFATVQELLWYNCSPVCGSSAPWLCSGINDNLLQEDLCHMLHLPGLLQPERLSPQQATVTHASAEDTNTQKQVWLRRTLRRTLLFSLGPGVHKVLFSHSKCLWQLR